ncbi:MAG TPA: DinB family protein [Gemmatimonadaceae bacterium]|nr:DinB family protein [Gemmatimonadaceae bacterium]
MAAAIAQTAHGATLLDANRAVIARIREAVTGVDPAVMVRQPPAGGWSVAEVLEHLIVSADSYLTIVKSLVERNGRIGANGDALWKPTLAGGLLVWSFRSPRKLPAPGSYKPGRSPRPRVLEEFLQRQEHVGRLITESAGLDWRRVKMRSPVAPILRMNLGDALTILVTHAERHAGQIERVLGAVRGE